jgi:hypothetical protein
MPDDDLTGARADHPVEDHAADVRPPIGSDPKDHPLIAAQLAELAEQLPGDIVEELADGLRATYARHNAGGVDPDAAAARAVAEFGEARVIAREFRPLAPGRRMALLLLATGPLAGACWAAALISEQAWTWPVPMTVRILCAAALIVLVATLATASLARCSYQRLNRLAAAAGLGLLAMDALLLTTLLTLSPSIDGLPLLAVVASSARMTLTGTRLPALLAR